MAYASHREVAWAASADPMGPLEAVLSQAGAEGVRETRSMRGTPRVAQAAGQGRGWPQGPESPSQGPARKQDLSPTTTGTHSATASASQVEAQPTA